MDMKERMPGHAPAGGRAWRGRQPGGYALLISMSMLMLLAGLATVFVQLSSVERDTSRSYVDQVRARMIAESALDFAMVQVRVADLRRAWSDPLDPANAWYYRGEDANLNFALDGGEEIMANGILDVSNVKLNQARTVSFHKGLGPDGLGYSVELPGTYQTLGDLGVIKVVDCASQFNVNNFDVAGHPGNRWLPRMLNNLSDITGEHTTPQLPAPLNGVKLGTRLIAALAARGNRPYTDKQEMLGDTNLFRNCTQAFDKVQHFLTTQSWIDKDTVRFDPNLANNRWNTNTPIASPRAPINVNTATYEVLVALLWGLTGRNLTYNYNAVAITAFLNAPATVTINRPDAERAARHIIDGRALFAGGAARYYDWMHFRLEAINTIPGLTQPQKDLINAAVNPNTSCRKFNPDKIVINPDPLVDVRDYTLIDKLEISDGGTEFTWGAMGYYEVEAHGRLYRDDILIAEHRLRTTCRVSEVFRVTTQKQFEEYRIWSNPSSGYGMLHDGGNAPIVSVPEYPFNRDPQPRYKSLGPDATGGTANNTAWCATWDGALLLNGLANNVIGTDGLPAATSKRSLFATFGRETVRADAYPRRGDAPGYGYNMWECNMSNQAYYWPMNSIQTDVNYYQSFWGAAPPAAGGAPNGPRRPNVLNSAPGTRSGWPVSTPMTMADDGHDLTAHGIYFNYLKRQRFHTFYGDEMCVPEASVEMFIKPEIDIRRWGRNVSNVCKQLIFFDWGPVKAGYQNCELRLFTSNGRVFADFIFGAGVGGSHYVLYGDADWDPHTWHHVEVSFSDKVKARNAAGAIVDVVRPNAMLFLDGNAVTMTGGLGTPLTPPPGYAGIAAPRGPAMLLPSAPTLTNRGNFSYGTDPWIVFGGAQTLSADNVFSMARGNWIGTLDNLGMHGWRHHDTNFVPKSRYHDPSYRAYSRSITYSGVGSFDVGIYMRRLKELEDAVTASGQAVLGTIACTHFHPYHEHIAGGHWGGVTAFGHMTPRLMIDDGGASLFYSFYDGCAGVPIQDPDGLGGFVNHVAKPGNKLYFAAEFEVADTLPVNQCSYLDDFTVTYSTGIRVLSRAVLQLD